LGREFPIILERKAASLTLMRKWFIPSAFVLLLILIALFALRPTIKAVARERAAKVLGIHFASKVEFSDFNISLFPSVHVTITGLVLRHKGRTDIPPLIQVREISMYANLPSLLRSKPHISFVQLQGLQIHTPPREPGDQPLIQKTDQDLAKKYPVLIEEVHADDAIIVVLRAQPEKPPREFSIHHLVLHDVNFDRPGKFHATLTNAVPKVEIDASGEFGPWLPEIPSETPANGQFTFQNADLGTLKGLRGTLSSKGQFDGPLDYLTVEGETDAPDFGLRTMGHPVALHTDFSALVDGTNGDVILNSVTAKFLHTVLAVSGEIVDVSKDIKGRTILLNAVSNDARVEDLLRLAVNSDEAVMTGSAKLKTKINIPQGDADLLERLKLNGQFGVGDAQFTSPAVQGKIDTLSRKSQGQPKDTDISNVASELKGTFRVSDGVVTFSDLSFAIAGASLKLHGTYNLDSTEMDFHGKMMMQAKLSQTTTGAKSFFLKAVDPFFRGRNGGTELPIKITGTKDHPAFGLDRGGDNKKSDLVPTKKSG
jgi:AsmA-like protein